MKIVERTRRPLVVAESARTREDRAALQRALRRARERSAQAFEQGWASAVRELRAGATVEQLEAKMAPALREWEDTAPIQLPDAIDFAEDTQVD